MGRQTPEQQAEALRRKGRPPLHAVPEDTTEANLQVQIEELDDLMSTPEPDPIDLPDLDGAENLLDASVLAAIRQSRNLIDPFEFYPFNDSSFAQMMDKFHGGTIRGLAGTDEFIRWDRKRKRRERLNMVEMRRHHQPVREMLMKVRWECLKASKSDTVGDAQIEKLTAQARSLQELARKYGERPKIEASLRELGALKPISLDAFDKKPHLLAVANGVLDFSNAEAKSMVDLLRPQRREDMLLKNTNVRFDNYHFPTDRVSRALDLFLPDLGLRKSVFTVMGYGTRPDNTARKVAICLGDTSTGKSTILAMADQATGEYSGPISEDMFRDKKGTGDTALNHARQLRMGFLSEPNGGWTAASFKRLAGGQDSQAGRDLYSNGYVTGSLPTTFYVALNKIPEIKDADRAVAKRLLVMPFDNQIPKDAEDKQELTQDYSQDEREDILYRIVEGRLEYERNHFSTLDPAIREATAEAIGDLSPFERWSNSRFTQITGHPAFEDGVRQQDVKEVYLRDHQLGLRIRSVGADDVGTVQATSLTQLVKDMNAKYGQPGSLKLKSREDGERYGGSFYANLEWKEGVREGTSDGTAEGLRDGTDDA